jgi:hypothetical protein
MALAHQRRRECDRDRFRRGRRLAGLGLALAGVLSACAPEQTGPATGGGILEPPGPPAHGDGTSANALIGAWQLVTVIPIGGDLQSTTVLWEFAADLSCRRTVTTLLVSEGIPRTSVQDCEYVPDINSVTVTFPNALPANFTVSFAAFDADRLVLDGMEYQRVG